MSFKGKKMFLLCNKSVYTNLAIKYNFECFIIKAKVPRTAQKAQWALDMCKFLSTVTGTSQQAFQGSMLRVANIFCTEPGGKHFSLCWPDSPCCVASTLLGHCNWKRSEMGMAVLQ